MASRKRGLSNEEIQRLLFDDNDSDDDISELDSDDNLSSSSSVDNNDDGDASDATVLYSVDSSQYVWSDTDTFDRSPLQFTGTPGRRVPVTDTADSLEYFNLFITDNMIDNIVTETNRHAQQLMQSLQMKRRSRLNNWVDTTPDELRVLLTILMTILMLTC